MSETIGDGVGPVKRYFFDQELARAWGVSRRTTARWRELGLIGHVQLPGGQKVLYLSRHIREFAARAEHPAKRPRGRPRAPRKTT